jgi:hypothetical protein
MLGDVTINIKRDYGYGDPIVESHDKSKIPEGFVSMGTAHTDFGDIDIYIAEDGGGNHVYSQILISGLY